MTAIAKKLIRSVYPVFIKHPTGDPLPLTYEGTGFFISMGNRLVFITAGHVGIQPGREKRDILVIPEQLEEGKVNPVYCQGDAFIDQKQDFFAMVLYPHTLDKFENEPIPLRVCDALLNPFDDVFTFGYPFTSVEVSCDPDTGAQGGDATIRPLFQKGYITRLVSAGELRPLVHRYFKTNYQLSFPSYNGLSGAPIMVVKESDWYVAGLLYHNTETRFYRGPLEVEEDTATGRRTETYVQYEFGLASTFEPFESLKGFLASHNARK